MPSAAALAPYHLLVYSFVYGTTAYQSFVSGIVAFKTLPWEQFSNLQSRIFPAYFALQTVTTGILLASPPFALTTVGYSALGTAFAGALLNSAVITPRVVHIKAKRHAQMEIEGKNFNDPTASDVMKKLNKEFAVSHGVSVVFNLASFVGLTVYGFLLTKGLSKVVHY